jgi:hypothetical protein
VKKSAEMTDSASHDKNDASNKNDIPLFATPSITLADLKTQKGFLSSSGFLTVNSGMYTYGNISAGSMPTGD